jgi:hypothetical protein
VLYDVLKELFLAVGDGSSDIIHGSFEGAIQVCVHPNHSVAPYPSDDLRGRMER